MRYVAYLPYLLLAILNSISTARHMKRWENVTKPLLMPTLLLAYWLTAGQRESWVAAGIAFGFLGDVLLMGTGTGFVIGGMGGFLLGHVCYGVAMVERLAALQSWMYPLLALMTLLLGRCIDARYRLIKGKLGAMRSPVFAYLIAIGCMAVITFMYALTAGKPAAWLAVAGSILFIVSDAILAEQLFTGGAKNLAKWIMPTYCAAQLFIALSLS